MKMIRYNRDLVQMEKDFRQTSSLVHTIICATNDIAHSCMVEAIAELKQTKHYRHEVKKIAKQAVAEYEKYEKACFNDMKGKEQLYMDYLDFANEETGTDVQKLFLAIKSILDMKGLDETILKAHIICTEMMLCYSVMLFDRFFEMNRDRYKVDFSTAFMPARLATTRNLWKLLSGIVCRSCADINFDESKNIRMAFSVIENKLTSMDTVNKCGYKAIELDDNLRERFADELEEYNNKKAKKHE